MIALGALAELQLRRRLQRQRAPAGALPVHASDTATRLPATFRRVDATFATPRAAGTASARRGRGTGATGRRGVGTGVAVGTGVGGRRPAPDAPSRTGRAWFGADRVAAAVAARPGRRAPSTPARLRSPADTRPLTQSSDSRSPAAADAGVTRRARRAAVRRAGRSRRPPSAARASRAPPPRSRARPLPDGVQRPRELRDAATSSAVEPITRIVAPPPLTRTVTTAPDRAGSRGRRRRPRRSNCHRSPRCRRPPAARRRTALAGTRSAAGSATAGAYE